jgi:hypothetical protein
MSFEQIQQPKATTTYYTYKVPDDGELKEGSALLKVDASVEGYYHQSFEGKGQYKTLNHVLIKEDNTHHVIPGAKDVDADFVLCKKGMLTRFTYLGKKSFDYTDKEGNQGKAKAIKAAILQDSSKTCSFEGDKYAATVVIGKDASIANGTTVASDAPITAEDVPF